MVNHQLDSAFLFISKEGRDGDERAEGRVLDEGLGVTFSELYKCG